MKDIHQQIDMTARNTFSNEVPHCWEVDQREKAPGRNNTQAKTGQNLLFPLLK